MISLLIILAIILINVVPLVIVYKILKKIEKRELLIFMAVSVGIIYVLIQFIFLLSGIGIDETVHYSVKNMIVFVFVPINIILFIPFLAVQYKKVKEKKIKYVDFANKIATCVVILIIVSVIEFFYFRSVQMNVKEIQENANQIYSETTNSVEENKTSNNAEEKVVNNVQENKVNNQVKTNQTI